MKLRTNLAIIFALLMHHLSPVVTSIAKPMTKPNTSSASFSFLFSNCEGPDHTIHRANDGFLHLHHKLNSSLTNVTTLQPETFHPVYLHYSTSVSVGTGNGVQTYLLKTDTLTSLTWLQCNPCAPQAKQFHPIFDPTESPTFRHVTATNPACRHPYEPAGEQCAFHISGPNRFSVHGFLALDLFIKNGEVPNQFFFGCSHSTENFESEGRFAGVFGMGRMPSSLVMQVAAQGFTQFSYCLYGGSKTKRHSLLNFGTDIPRSPNSSSTRILAARDTHESEYYLSLIGISLGGQRLDKIHPEILARDLNGQGGCVIDIGTSLTMMVEEAYHIVEEAIWLDLQHHQVERAYRPGFGLCVRATKAIKRHLPSLSLHFSEEKAALVFSPKQLFLMMNEKQGQIACLAMVPGQRTVIGAFQQVDTRFIYDLKDSKLSFAPASCIRDTVEAV